MGEMRLMMGELPVTGRMRRRRIKVPYLALKSCHSNERSRGSKPATILAPSNGWTGTRLKIAKPTLRAMTGKKMEIRFVPGNNLMMRLMMKARIRLLAGPAREMIAPSVVGFFRL